MFRIIFWLSLSPLLCHLAVTQVSGSEDILESIENAIAGDPSWEGIDFKKFSLHQQLLAKLILAEHEFYELLRQYGRGPSCGKDKELLESGNRYVEIYNDEVIGGASKWQSLTRTKQTYLSTYKHPILIYKLLRRLATELPPVFQRYWAVLKDVPVGLRALPTHEDVARYADLIVKLPFSSEFTATEMSQGIINKIQTGIELDSVQTMELIEAAIDQERFTVALEFLVHAKNLSVESKEDLETVAEVLEIAVEEHDKQWADPKIKTVYATKLNSVESFLRNRGRLITRQEQIVRKFQDGTLKASPGWSVYDELLCAGKDLRISADKQGLKCWLDFSQILIAPYKMELLNKKPRLLQIHEIIPPKLAAGILQYTDLTKRVPGNLKIDGDGKIWFVNNTGSGVSSLSFAENDGATPDTLELLSSSIAVATQLNIPVRPRKYSRTEPSLLSILAPSELRSYKKRSAYGTVLINIRPPVAGGLTAFPSLGFAVKSEPLSALLWVNPQDGAVKPLVYHAECPVLLGHKIVAQQFIVQNGQTQKCPAKLK